MTSSLELQLQNAELRIRSLRTELEETHKGLLALSCELENQIETLRLSERSYRCLVEDAVCGICRCLADGTIVEANRALVEMLGFDSKEGLVEASQAGQIFTSEGERLGLLAQLRSERQVRSYEICWCRCDGVKRLGQVSGRAIDSPGVIGSYELVFEDLTERHALEEQLRQSQKMEAVGQLAGGVAHDFNNLLTSILGNAEILHDRLDLRDELQLEVGEILGAGHRAAELTRQLLTFSRRQLPVSGSVDLNHVVQDLNVMLQRLIGEGVRLEILLSSEVGSVRVDRSQLEQVVMNLVINAREAMPTGGRIVVRTLVADALAGRPSHPSHPAGAEPDPSLRWICLSVEDTGSGIPDEVRERIFEPFFTTKGAGTGLGLATVYGVVNRLGGRLEVESEEGAGSTFRVYLPEAPPTPSASRERLSRDALAGDERVLVVEDEESVRRLVCRTLARYGYDVLDAASPEEALRIIDREPIDVLLSDIRLPVRSGVSLARELLGQRPDLRVLLISGYYEDETLEVEGASARIAFVPKPFTAQTLVRHLRELIDARPAEAPDVASPLPTQ